MTPHAILFGSIGTLAETSELQRSAFNEAFRQFDLDWHWTADYYRDQLAVSGGQNRIAVHAAARGMKIDAQAIHALKTDIFNQQLLQGGLVTRPGVVKVIQYAQLHGIKLAFVTTTSRDNVDAVLTSLAPYIDAEMFDYIGTSEHVGRSKPAPDAYHLALAKLGLSASDCLAIEDSQPSLAAALAAGIPTIAFPGANTIDQDYAGAQIVASHLDPQSLFETQQAAV